MLGYLQCKSLKYSPEKKIFKICSNLTFFSEQDNPPKSNPGLRKHPKR